MIVTEEEEEYQKGIDSDAHVSQQSPAVFASLPQQVPHLILFSQINSAFEEELNLFKQNVSARLAHIWRADRGDVTPLAMHCGMETRLLHLAPPDAPSEDEPARFSAKMKIAPPEAPNEDEPARLSDKMKIALPDAPSKDKRAGLSTKMKTNSVEATSGAERDKASESERTKNGRSLKVGIGDSESVKKGSGSRLGSFLGIGTTHAPDMLAGALNLRAKDSSPMRGSSKWFRLALTDETKHFKKVHPFRGEVRIFVLHPVFDICFGLLVLVSVVLMGVEIEWVARDNATNTAPFFVVQCVCCVFFTVEVALRMVAFGRGFWGIGSGAHVRNWKWNLFDMLCTITMIVDLMSEQIEDTHVNVAQGNQARLFRFFRLFRIIRAVRCVRMVRWARELRKMFYALQYSFHTLLWAMLLLIFEMFFFATAFTQATTEVLMTSIDDADEELLSDLQRFYGTLPNSYFSLFQSITGGEDWVRLVMPLRAHTHWINTLLFLSFTAITTFGVMNVITSVFVESALASAKHYKDLMIQERAKQKQVYIDHLRDVFSYIDYDSSGEISCEEMDRLLHDEDLKLYLESIEIQPDDARTLFSLLDKDQSGQVNIDDFCKGCLKLKGEAKSYDIHCIIYENHRLMHKWQQFMTYLEDGFLPKILHKQRLRVSGNSPAEEHEPAAAQLRVDVVEYDRRAFTL